jgi:REP element-mobilizing transposase RayT
MDRLLDQARCGPTYLKQPAVADIVLTSLQCGSEIKHYDLHAWVIMPNHVHLLLTPQVSLSKLLNSLKAATARRANLIQWSQAWPEHPSNIDGPARRRATPPQPTGLPH